MVDTNTTAKKARKSTKPAAATQQQSEELTRMLDNIEVQYAPYSSLFIGDLNARKVPHSDEELRGYADSIRAVGLLHNLIVVTCDDGRLEVVCGGGRTKAIGLLVSDGEVDPDKVWIAYKAVPRELAREVSEIENAKRKDMHPADQIRNFLALSGEGKTPEQIGAVLGYSQQHVLRMLKLAGLAPEILDGLARDELTTEHCHALALENDQNRQLQVLEAVRSDEPGKLRATSIRALITAKEVSTTDQRFQFIGAGEFSDEQIRVDLFSQVEGGYVDAVLLNEKLLAKLQQKAEQLQQEEGWAWSQSRLDEIRYWGDDSLQFKLQTAPQPIYSKEEQRQLDEYTAQYEEFDSYCDESRAVEKLIVELQMVGESRAWTDEQKQNAGVFVSYDSGCFCIQRGVLRVEPRSNEDTESNRKEIITIREPDIAEGISEPLIKKMSSERTLAVQAALLQQPQKALALLVWRLCACTFQYCNTATHPFVIRLEVHHSGLVQDAPSGEKGAAWLCLMQEKARLEALLPKGWKRDFTTFFELDEQTLMALMVFCTACSIDGVQTRTMGRTTRSDLEPVEEAIGFHMRDWWQPTKENFFMHMQKPQIIAALNEAGKTGAARDAEKMKKGDAAELAESNFADTRWVPSWMQSAKPSVTPLTDETDIADNAENNPAEAA